MRSFWPGFIFVGWALTCAGQVTTLPELNFDRRRDAAYMDSLLVVGRQYIRQANYLPAGRRNDTLRLEGIRFLAQVFKQMTGSARDSSYLYAGRLEDRARRYGNTLYVVRAMMLQEYYLRTVKDDYIRALTINQRASALCRQLPIGSSPRWQVQMNMGDIYLLIKEYDDALASYDRSLTYLRDNTSLTPRNRQLLIGQAMAQMGEVYEIQKQYDRARYQYEASRQMALDTRSKTNVAYADERLGDFFITQHQPEQAIRVFDEGLAIWKQLGDLAGQASIWARLAECYVLINRPVEAIDYGEKALVTARRAGYRRIQPIAAQALYRAYRLTGDLDKALTMYENYVVIRDSLNMLRRVEELASVQKKYDIGQIRAEADQERFVQQQRLFSLRRQAELDRLRADAERTQFLNDTRMEQLRQRLTTERILADAQKNRLEQRARINTLSYDIEQAYLIRTFLVVGLAMLLLFLIVYYRKNRQISQQKGEIENLNRGLEDKVAARTVELEQANKQLRAKNREIEEALLQGQALERKRMAADLHDSLGGLLAAIKVSLSALNPAHLSEREQGIYQNLLGMSREAFAEIRYLSHNLQPDELEKQGLSEALIRLVDKLNRTQTITFRLETDDLPRLDKTTEFNLYSICIELCSNIIRHSEATEADILFRRFNGSLNMIVKDNGCGMNPDDATGMGLRNIQARMDLIRGRYEVHSELGGGTTFIFVLPLRANLATV